MEEAEEANGVNERSSTEDITCGDDSQVVNEDENPLSYIYAIAPKLTTESSAEQVDINKTPAFQCLDEVY